MVNGEVAPGFEAVRDAFEQHADDVRSGGGAFAAFVQGRKVVDLWAGLAGPGRPWAADTLAVLMSSTKGLCSLCAQILYDRGQLDLRSPVAAYWPEFAASGKQDITVEQVLSHTSGVVSIAGHEHELSFDGPGWADTRTIASWVAASTPAWEPGTAVGYHALTFGWIVGELIRRVDGRTLGAFFREEVAEPFGLDLLIGTPPDQQARVATVVQDPPEVRAAASSALPPEARAAIDALMRDTRDPATPTGRAFIARDGTSVLEHLDAMMNRPAVLEAEIGSSNGTGTAAALARFYAILAGGGELEGRRAVSRAAVDTFAERRAEGPDVVLQLPAAWSLGYMANLTTPPAPPRFGPTPTAFGHPGAGGQRGFADPERGVAVGFVRSHMATMHTLSDALIDALYASL